MDDRRIITNLAQLLEQLDRATQDKVRVDVSTIVAAVGSRSFGSLLLVAGLVTLAPVIGDIPGIPTLMGAFVLLISLQLLLRRTELWLPKWLLERSVARDKFAKAMRVMHPTARFIDRWLKPRLTYLTQGPGLHAIAALCIVIAAGMPLMEVVPFSANGAGAALTAFGLALIARDGLLALLAFSLIGLTAGFIAYQLI